MTKCSNGKCKSKPRAKNKYCDVCYKARTKWAERNWVSLSLKASKKTYDKGGVWIIGSGR